MLTISHAPATVRLFMSPQELEARWVAQAKNGDQAAFANLVRAHHGRVLACAINMLKRRSDAEDAAQEAFVRAWRFLPKFDGRSKFSTWIYRICVNVCLNQLRRSSNREKPTEDETIQAVVAKDGGRGENPGEKLEQSMLRDRLLGAIDGLSPALKSAAVLVLVHGMSHGEAAEVLECAEGTVSWRVHEARRQLRDKLQDMLPGQVKKTKRSAS